MNGVVPQPGPTLPYSEFRGRRIAPSLVLKVIGYFSCGTNKQKDRISQNELLDGRQVIIYLGKLKKSR